MHAVGPRRERHIDPVVDDERHAEWRERGLQGARLFDHVSSVVHLVAQLHEGCPTGRDRAGEINEIMAAGVFRIDNGVEAQVELFHWA